MRVTGKMLLRATTVLLLACAPRAALAAASAVNPVYVDAAGFCDGLTPCFTTIQAGVNHAFDPIETATVFIFPATYVESVNLSTAGTQSGGSPGDILLMNTDFFFLASIAATSPTSEATVGIPDTSRLDAWWAKAADIQFRLSRFVDEAATKFGGPLGSSFDGAAGVLPPSFEFVRIRPAAGPAIFHSMVPYPGDVSFAGLDVLSPNDDGIRIDATGSVSTSLILASGNGKNGIWLTVDDEVLLQLTRADDNELVGILIEADDGVTVLNCSADANGGSGIQIDADNEVLFFAFPLFIGAPEIAALFDPVTANLNGNVGISIVAGDSASIVALPAVPQSGIFANDNTGPGVAITSGDDSTVGGVATNRNSVGVVVKSDGVADFFGVAANDNDADGISATATGTEDPDDLPLPLTSARFERVLTNGNEANGIQTFTPNGIVIINDSATSDNGADGIELISLPAALTSIVRGNIICGNTTSGLRLLAASNVDAAANWWGSTTGPFHAAKNPNGTGNQVIDATSGGGMGDVDFTPFIDTVTGSATGNFSVGASTTVRFQFSGGDGTVFLGPDFSLGIFPILDPPAPGPFNLTTDNGILRNILGPGSGPSIFEYITILPGTVQATLIPARVGTATVTVEGPCGPTGSLAVRVGPLGAPLMSGMVLAVLAGVLALLGVKKAGAKRSPRSS